MTGKDYIVCGLIVVAEYIRQPLPGSVSESGKLFLAKKRKRLCDLTQTERQGKHFHLLNRHHLAGG